MYTFLNMLSFTGCTMNGRIASKLISPCSGKNNNIVWLIIVEKWCKSNNRFLKSFTSNSCNKSYSNGIVLGVELSVWQPVSLAHANEWADPQPTCWICFP